VSLVSVSMSEYVSLFVSVCLCVCVHVCAIHRWGCERRRRRIIERKLFVFEYACLYVCV